MEGEVSSNMDNKIKNKLNIDTIILKLTMLMLILAPLFRGLFFEKERAYFHIASFLLALVYMIAKLRTNEFKLIRSKSDLFAFLLMLIYIVSISYAVDKRAAIIEAIKYVNYFVIYMLIRNLAKTKKEHNIVINSLLVGGFIVTMIGILAAVGIVKYNGAVMGSRISSTFQYPNALASYLLALYVITIGKSLVTNNKKIRLVYLNLANLFVFTFILTYSRGMWLIYPIILVIYFALINREYKLRTIKYNVVTNIISVPSAFLFASRMQEQNQAKLIGILLISMGLFTILAMLSFKLERKIEKISLKKIVVSIVSIAIILSGVLVFLINQTEPVLLKNDGTEDKWTTFYRDIYELDSNEKYTVSIDYEILNTKLKPYAGRIRVIGIDKDNRTVNTVLDEYLTPDRNEDGSYKDYNNEVVDARVVIDFDEIESQEDKDKIRYFRLSLQNYYADTSMKIKKVIITNKEGQLIKDVKLKYKYIPESIARRIESIGVNDNSADARITFYEDASKIIKNNFLIGTGGGGWKAIYRKYQSYNYAASEAHNYYMQLFIEVGFIGFIMFIGLILSIFVICYKIYRNIYKELNFDYDLVEFNTIHKSLMIGIITILTHAILDFDLSLSAFTMILFALFGIVVSNYKEDKILKLEVNKINSKNIISFVAIVLTLVNLGIISSFKIANVNAINAAKLFEEDKDKSLAKLETASKLDFVNVDYKKDLSKMYLEKFKETKDDSYISRSQILMKESVGLSPNDFGTLKTASFYYLSIGNIEKGLSLADKLVQRQPLNIESYKIKCDAYLYGYSYYINSLRDMDKAKETIARAMKIKEEIEQAKEKTSRPFKLDKQMIYKLGYIKFNSDSINNKIDYEIPKRYRLKTAYYFDMDLDNNSELDYINISNHKDGNLRYDIKDDYIRIMNNKAKYGFLYTRLLEFQPEKDYNVNVTLAGNIAPDNLDIYIYCPSSKQKIQGRFEIYEVGDNSKAYSVNFKTTKDIGDNVYIRIFHKGNDEGYIDLYSISLFEK
ncbi:O-antigen ligase family protein [Peptostreptococcaceae bacterium AGR-M142]